MKKWLLVSLAISMVACTTPNYSDPYVVNFAGLPLTVKKYTVYVPGVIGVKNTPLPTPTRRPTTTPTATPVPCPATSQAAIFENRLRTDVLQQRRALQCNPALVRAALFRAQSMAEGGYFAHCDPRGICANRIAIEAGCQLPGDYPPNGNNIESILAGTNDPNFAYNILIASPSHKTHLLGVADFFRKQDQVGIAFLDAPGSKYRYYWVVLIARCVNP